MITRFPFKVGQSYPKITAIPWQVSFLLYDSSPGGNYYYESSVSGTYTLRTSSFGNIPPSPVPITMSLGDEIRIQIVRGGFTQHDVYVYQNGILLIHHIKSGGPSNTVYVIIN